MDAALYTSIECSANTALKIFKLHYTNQIPINALDFSTANKTLFHRVQNLPASPGFPLTPKRTFIGPKNRSKTSKIVCVIAVSNEYKSNLIQGQDKSIRPLFGL